MIDFGAHQNKFEQVNNDQTISVIILCYNYGKYLEEAVNSLLLQTKIPDEILIIDDASTDDTEKFAEQCIKKDTRIKYIKNEKNLGMIQSFNKGMQNVSGKYICLLDADNRLRSTYIEKCVFTLQSQPDVAIVYTDIAAFGKAAYRASITYYHHKWKEANYKREDNYYIWCSDIHKSAMFKRSAYDKICQSNEFFELCNVKDYEDRPLWCDIMVKSNAKVVKIAEPLLEYRMHFFKQQVLDQFIRQEKYKPIKISSYITVLNCERFCFPYIECVKSALEFSDEVVVLDGGSEDQTLIRLQDEIKDSRLKIYVDPWDYTDPASDGIQKTKAKSLCSSDSEFLIQIDADCIIHEDDYDKVENAVRVLKKSGYSVGLWPCYTFVGSFKTLKRSFGSFREGVVKNDSNIIHGIIGCNRIIDSTTGKITTDFTIDDSCAFIYKNSLEKVKSLRIFGPQYIQAYAEKDIEMIRLHSKHWPVFYHYGWADFYRKLENKYAFWESPEAMKRGKKKKLTSFDYIKIQEDVEKALQDPDIFEFPISHPAIMRNYIQQALDKDRKRQQELNIKSSFVKSEL